jgi:sulfite exporter TauE/SafE
MADKEVQDETTYIKLKSKFWTGFVFGMGFSLGTLIILFFIIGIIALVLNSIYPGFLF